MDDPSRQQSNARLHVQPREGAHSLSLLVQTSPLELIKKPASNLLAGQGFRTYRHDEKMQARYFSPAARFSAYSAASFAWMSCGTCS